MKPCRLCLKNKPLVESHFIPKKAYAPLRSLKRKNSNPTMVNRKIVLRTSYQAQDLLLCRDCEDRFSKRGESWVVPRLAHKTKFKLLEVVQKAPVVETMAGSTGVNRACAGVAEFDVEKITYFALSIFWRAAVHDWKDTTRMDLGPYEDQIRRWLLDEVGFPKNVFLHMSVSEESPEIFNILPPLRLVKQPYHGFYCFLPGVEFLLFVGNRVDPYMKKYCLYQSKENIVSVGGDVRLRMGRLMAHFMYYGPGLKKLEAFNEKKRKELA